MLGHIAKDQPRPAKDMGLVKDGDIIGQGLEVYHGHRVASAGVHGKVLNWIKRDFSAATAPCDRKLLQILKMFAASFLFVCGVEPTRHSAISSKRQRVTILERNIFRS